MTWTSLEGLLNKSNKKVIFHRPRITGHPVTKSGHEHHYQPHGLTLGREGIRLQNSLNG